ncbi:MAG: FAD-dependent oxidoreductase, partial [Actinobacteria bacterium]|nr:FAD-dependent oxidoreductase [Actinomycetota bacterium]
MTGKILIVGANAGGQATAGGLREGGFDGDVVLVGDEPVAPYERPVLSKEYLQGTQDLERSFLRPGNWFQEQGIDARFGTSVEAVDVAAKTATLAGGEQVGWSKLMLATGIR